MKEEKKHKKNWDEAKNLLGEKGLDKVVLGPYYSASFSTDLKHFMIILARYKFVSKLLKFQENSNVLEVGCSEGLGGLMITNEVSRGVKYIGIDQDSDAIAWANRSANDSLKYICGDFFENHPDICENSFDSIFSLDVIEHIAKEDEDAFVKRILELLKSCGCVIIGTPCISMNPYASEASRIAHINMFDHKRLYSLMNKYFENVFIFSMTDEVVHTGFEPMSCYIFALCAGKKEI